VVESFLLGERLRTHTAGRPRRLEYDLKIDLKNNLCGYVVDGTTPGSCAVADIGEPSDLTIRVCT